MSTHDATVHMSMDNANNGNLEYTKLSPEQESQLRAAMHELYGLPVRERATDKATFRTRAMTPLTPTWRAIPYNRHRRLAIIGCAWVQTPSTLAIGTYDAISALTTQFTSGLMPIIKGPVSGSFILKGLNANPTTTGSYTYYGANAVALRFFAHSPTVTAWISVADYTYLSGTPI